MNETKQLPKEEIEPFCQRPQIRKLSLFGSVLRDDLTSVTVHQDPIGTFPKD